VTLWLTQRSVCTKHMSSQCQCVVRKHGQSQRLLLGDWMPLTHGHSKKYLGSHMLATLPTLLSGRLLAALHFPVSLKQDGSASLATWHVCIPGKIITKQSMHCCDHHETGGDLKGAHIPPAWGGLMLMCSQLTLVSTEPGGRPTILFSWDVSSMWQHSIVSTPLKKKISFASSN